MDTFSDTEQDDARKFGNFIIDLIENHRDSFAYYLSETALLDWYGHTVRTERNIEGFLKNHVGDLVHDFPSFHPAQSIGYRDTHVIKFAT